MTNHRFSLNGYYRPQEAPAAGPGPFGGQVGGIAPDHQSYDSYAVFTDPDGDGWVLQEVTTRFPGRIDAAETALSVR